MSKDGPIRENPGEKRLRTFFARYEPEIATLGKTLLAKMRKRMPGAVELAYDNYNALVIAFSATDRASDAIFSIALYPRWVNLFFAQGAGLPDPGKRLMGSGKAIRHVVLRDAADFDQPAIKALMAHALRNAARLPDANEPGRLVIKSVSERQRARRPAQGKPIRVISEHADPGSGNESG